MKEVYSLLILLLVLNLLVGFVRVLRGPILLDSMLASILVSNGGTAFILVMYKFLGQPQLLNVALSFALLSGVMGVAFAIILLADAD